MEICGSPSEVSCPMQQQLIRAQPTKAVKASETTVTAVRRYRDPFPSIYQNRKATNQARIGNQPPPYSVFAALAFLPSLLPASATAKSNPQKHIGYSLPIHHLPTALRILVLMILLANHLGIPPRHHIRHTLNLALPQHPQPHNQFP